MLELVNQLLQREPANLSMIGEDDMRSSCAKVATEPIDKTAKTMTIRFLIEALQSRLSESYNNEE